MDSMDTRNLWVNIWDRNGNRLTPLISALVDISFLSAAWQRRKNSPYPTRALQKIYDAGTIRIAACNQNVNVRMW